MTTLESNFRNISINEVRKMFNNTYVYCWSANNKFYGVTKGNIRNLSNNNNVDLWKRGENVLSSDRGVVFEGDKKNLEFSTQLRPAFLTFDTSVLPVYQRDNKLNVRNPLDIADNLNKNIQKPDYIPSDDKYGYDMKDSNAVIKAYTGIDDLVVIYNVDKRDVVDINPPERDPETDVIYHNNVPFNHNYNLIWSSLRSGRIFEEFNDEINDDGEDSRYVNTSRYTRRELVFDDPVNISGDVHIKQSGLFANIPNSADTYTALVQSDKYGDKQVYDKGYIGEAIINEIKWSLDAIDGKTCTITRRVYNNVNGEITNAQDTFDGTVSFEVVSVKDNATRIKRTFRIPSLGNIVCDYERFEYKKNASGTPISLPVPEEIVDGVVEYKLNTSNYTQATNGTVTYATRNIYIDSGNTRVLVDTLNNTGTANFTVYTLAANAVSATIKRTTSVKFLNTDNTYFNYTTTNNNIGTGTVAYTCENKCVDISGSNHLTKQTRTVTYKSGSTNVTVRTDDDKPTVSYTIWTLNAGATKATLKGSSTATFKSWANGAETTSTYTKTQTNHISVTSNDVTYTRNDVKYTNASSITCSQTMNVGYTYSGVTITKTITKQASIVHTVYTLAANASSATIRRVFTPVFYTLSNGVETTSIFKNSVVEIDKNKLAPVEYTVSSAVDSASNGKHYSIHTRNVTYTENNIPVEILKDTYSAEINYRIYTLVAGATKATLKGSSTGVFYTYDKNSKTSTTYNVDKTDHITVESGAITYSNSDITYTSASDIKCTRTLTVPYTAKSVTINKTISKTAQVVHSVKAITSSSSTLYRKYTPVFYTIDKGIETTSIYKNDVVALSEVAGNVAYTVSNAVDSASNGKHYSTHTRTVTYTENNVKITVQTTPVSAEVQYQIYTLAAGATKATLKGSSTATFKTWANGAETTSTYTKTQSNHITVDSDTITDSNYTNSAIIYTSATDIKCTRTLTINYTAKNVTIKKTISKTAAVGHQIYTLAANASTATIKRTYTPVFYTIANGAETSTNYNNSTIQLVNGTGDVTHTISQTIEGSGSSHTVKHTRTTTYTENNVTLTLETKDVSANVSYVIYTLAAGKTTATLRASSTAVFKTIDKGAETTTTYNSVKNGFKDVASDTITYSNGAVSYNADKINDATCVRTLTVPYTVDNVTIKRTITKTAKVSHRLYTLVANATSATVTRTYTPVFKTISNGVETSTDYNNSSVPLSDISATVSHTVGAISGSGSKHVTKHTRNVTYTNNGKTYTLKTDEAEGNVTYTIYTLKANETKAILKPKSVATTFKTIANGSDSSAYTNTLYLDNVESAPIAYTNGAISYNADKIDDATCVRTLKAPYTVDNVTLAATVAKTATVTHKLYTIAANATSATVTRTYTPVFKTIVNGAETSTNYNDSSVPLDNISATVSHTVGAILGDSGGVHTAKHTRKITYTNSGKTYTLLNDEATGNVTYTIYTLDAGATTAKLQPKSVATTFKTMNKGDWSSTYTNTLYPDKVTSNGTFVYTDPTTPTSGTTQTSKMTLKIPYTKDSMTLYATQESTANVSYSIKDINTNGANVYRKFTPIFYTVVNGSKTSTEFTKITNKVIDSVSATVEYTDANSVKKGASGNHYSTMTRKVTYNGTTVGTNTTVDSVITYSIKTLANATDASKNQFYGSTVGTFKSWSNGAETSSTYTKSKSNNITVTTTGISSATVLSSSDASGAKGIERFTLSYTYNSITKSLNIDSDAAALSYSVLTCTSAGSAVVHRTFTPVTYTYSNGSKTSTKLKNSNITFGSDVTVTPSYSAGSITGSGSNHYSSVTRTIQHTDGNYTYKHTTSNNGTVAYTLNNVPNVSSANAYASVTVSFNQISSGTAQSATYSKSIANFTTVNCSIRHYIGNHAGDKSRGVFKAVHFRTIEYTANNVRKKIFEDTATGSDLSCTLYNLEATNANSPEAQLKLSTASSTATFKTISSGSYTTSTYTTTQTNYEYHPYTTDITYSTLNAPATGNTTQTRTIKYTYDGVTVTVNTTTVNTTNSYSVVSHNGTSGTYKNTVTAKFYTVLNGATQSTVHTTKSANGTFNGTVSYYNLTIANASNMSCKVGMYNGTTLIASVNGNISNISHYMKRDSTGKNMIVHRRMTISGSLISNPTAAYSTTFEDDSINSVPIKDFVCGSETITTESASLTIYPITYRGGLISNGNYTYDYNMKCYTNGSLSNSIYTVSKICKGESKNDYSETITSSQIGKSNFSVRNARVNSSDEININFSIKDPYLNSEYRSSYLFSDIMVKLFTAPLSNSISLSTKYKSDSITQSDNKVSCKFKKSGTVRMAGYDFTFTDIDEETISTNAITSDKVSVINKDKKGTLYSCYYRLWCYETFNTIGDCGLRTSGRISYTAMFSSTSNELSVTTGRDETPSDASLKSAISNWWNNRSSTRISLAGVGSNIPTYQ